MRSPESSSDTNYFDVERTFMKNKDFKRIIYTVSAFIFIIGLAITIMNYHYLAQFTIIYKNIETYQAHLEEVSLQSQTGCQIHLDQTSNCTCQNEINSLNQTAQAVYQSMEALNQSLNSFSGSFSRYSNLMSGITEDMTSKYTMINGELSSLENNDSSLAAQMDSIEDNVGGLNFQVSYLINLPSPNPEFAFIRFPPFPVASAFVQSGEPYPAVQVNREITTGTLFCSTNFKFGGNTCPEVTCNTQIYFQVNSTTGNITSEQVNYPMIPEDLIVLDSYFNVTASPVNISLNILVNVIDMDNSTYIEFEEGAFAVCYFFT